MSINLDQQKCRLVGFGEDKARCGTSVVARQEERVLREHKGHLLSLPRDDGEGGNRGDAR